jgi:hypothetical protein
MRRSSKVDAPDQQFLRNAGHAFWNLNNANLVEEA